MRKGIVMEQKNEYTIVMTNDGCFHRAQRLESAEVGMEVHFKAVPEHKDTRLWTHLFRSNHIKVAMIAMVLLLALFPVYSWYGSNQAYAYMNIDINPSVEMELNDQMEVLNITPQNSEAKEIVSLLTDWKKKDASEVTFDMIQLSQKQGYVKDGNQVLIGISYLQSDVNQKYSDEIEEYLLGQSSEMSVATFLVPEELREQAQDQKESVNQLLADQLNQESSDHEKSSTPVSVEDDDKEIIQSFYNEDSSSPKEEKEPESSSAPADDKKETQKNTPKDKEIPGHKSPSDKGKESAPGQKKKQEAEQKSAKDVQKSGKAKGHEKNPSSDKNNIGKGKDAPKKDHGKSAEKKLNNINQSYEKKKDNKGVSPEGKPSNGDRNKHNEREKHS